MSAQPQGTRRVVEPMTHARDTMLYVTYYTPCHCVREKLAAAEGGKLNDDRPPAFELQPLLDRLTTPLNP